jgi:hypothetical protein
MVDETQRECKYFIANFGEKFAVNHPVDGGCYPVPACYQDAKVISEGDIMLLCCWAGHKDLYKGDCWGLGKVTSKEERQGTYDVFYKWKQLISPIGHDTICGCLEAENLAKRFRMGAASAPNWLFKIEPDSFLCILSNWS